MISQKVTTQAEIDAALLQLGIRPTGKYTKDHTQQLYLNADGKGIILPADIDGYSQYFVDDILAHVKNCPPTSEVVSEHTYVARPGYLKPVKD